MESLANLCNVTLEIHDRLKKDCRNTLIPELKKLFEKGVIVFDESYETFIGLVVDNQDSYDRWINVQLQFLTELGTREPLEEHFTTVKDLFSEMPGGESFIYPEKQTLSYLVALAIRNFVDMIAVEEELDPPPTPNKGGGK